MALKNCQGEVEGARGSGSLDVRVDSETETTSGLWQLPRLRIGIGTTIEGFARWFTG
jgi:hypothetical protein